MRSGTTLGGQGDNEHEPLVRPLHLLDTDVVIAELVSGRTITTSEGHSLVLPTDHARSVLDWYRRSRPKWMGNVMSADCEVIVDSISSAPPPLSAPTVPDSPAASQLKLVRLVAHRFAGLHAYGTATEPPADFVFVPEKPVTLFEGWNGSGKTSLANAIIWCLTGQLLRPQRLPEPGDKDFDCVVERDADGSSAHPISPVTPLPHSQDWTPDPSAGAVPADTWVELTFADRTGAILPTVRRTQSRRGNGKLTETVTDLAALGVDPVALHLGTTMPGMLQFIQVGGTSDLGVAIAKLTGLSDLVALARHAERASGRIGGTIISERKKELEQIDADFAVIRADLCERLEAFPAMRPPQALPEAVDADAADSLSRISGHFDSLVSEGLKEARNILGASFDPEDARQQADLREHVKLALGQMSIAHKLPSIDLIVKLGLNAPTRDGIRAGLEALRTEARELAALSENPVLARRTRLYARVVEWMAEHDLPHDDSCHVCRGSISGVIDPETGISVSDHFAQLNGRGGAIGKAIDRWARDWTGTLARDLPEDFRATLVGDLPESPLDLLRRGLCDELFDTQAFRGPLAAVKPQVHQMVDRAAAVAPRFVEPDYESLPRAVASQERSLSLMIGRIERALAFGDWMAMHPGTLRAAFDAVRGSFGDGSGSSHDDATLISTLKRLEVIVNGVAPVNAARQVVQRMHDKLGDRVRKGSRIAACHDTVRALATIVPIGTLAEDQVEGLRRQLHERAEHWRDQVYRNATSFSPRPQASGMNAQGVIDIHVGRGIVQAPAQHVSNASALRAALMGFYLAYREHLLATSGGIATLILDDPQDLLDYDNRQRLARTIGQLADGNAQIILTTHDRAFARMVVQESRSADRIAHRAVHPVNDSRATLDTSLAVEELDRKRQAFVDNTDSAPHAQDYANEARIFIEARLGDLFDDPAYPAHSASTRAPTLSASLDRLRALVNGRSNELFRSPALEDFFRIQALGANAEARRILNQSHHDKGSISYQDVKGIDADLKRLRIGIERVHAEFRRYRWREPLATNLTGNVVALTPVRPPTFSVPVSQDIAAFTGHIPSGGSQAHDDEYLSSAWLADKALFYIRNDTMGFAIPAGSVAMVEAAPSAARDHSLVVARRGNQAFARRLLRPRNGEGFSLAAEATDPRNSRPTLSFEDDAIDTHRVVGVLFSQLPPPQGREEATEIAEDPILGRVEVAYRVREDSAVPLALSGQVILGGGVLTPSSLARMEGRIVALTLSDGTSILKRVGTRVSSAFPYLRQFETIGGLGDSAVVAVETVENAPDLPVMAFARPVIGVIYDLQAGIGRVS